MVVEDAFSDDEDAFLVVEDAFLVDEDAFLVVEDAFSDDEDAFLVVEDAFLVVEDAFLVDEDAFSLTIAQKFVLPARSILVASGRWRAQRAECRVRGEVASGQWLGVRS